ncbi:RICIN domain-containing protein [Streptomyces sp. DSM 15324]|uniref:RICIN domain-containing protein n=1 Tax=Streptomyces sp. DSM 15324 TaxID=1739111 RepID=UPI003B63B431
MCLDVPSKSTAENVRQQQWTCNGGANQQFAADLVGSLTRYQVSARQHGQRAEHPCGRLLHHRGCRRGPAHRHPRHQPAVEPVVRLGTPVRT